MPNPLRVLVVEGSSDDVERMIRELCRADLESTGKRIETAEELRAALAEGAGTMVLLSRGHDLATGVPNGSEELFGIFGVAPGAFEHTYRVLVGGETRVVHEVGEVIVAEDGRPRRIAGTARDVTERARAEEVMARDAMLLAQVRDSVIVTDLNGIVTYWNEGATRLYGSTAGEMLGRPVTDRIPPEHRPPALATLEALRRGEEFSGEWEDFRKDGSRVWVDARVGLLRDRHGRPFGIMGVSHDVSARKRAESALRESERRFRETLEQAPLAAVWLDPAGRVTFCNDALLSLLEYAREEVLGRDWFATFLPPDVGPRVRQRFQEHLPDGRITPRYENEVQTRSGERRLVAWNNTVLRDPDGRPVGTSSIGEDVTRRRRAEEALRLRDRAIGTATQGILITDPNQPDNPLVYASPGFERLTGYAPAEVVGRNCRFLQGEQTDPGAVARLREAVRTGRPCTVELVNYRKDGSAFWNELSVSPVRDETGRLTHFVAVQADVTGRRSLEQQLRQAQKMEAVGQLAGGIAHDFNNLLTVINGSSDLVLRQLPPDDPSRSLMEEIQRAGERSAALTRQLLLFSRKQVAAPKVLDLNEVVAGAEKLLRRVIGEDVRLETALRPLAGRVKADPGQLEQVLMNLAVNARDAMPRGGRLTIETANADVDEEAARRHAGARPGPFLLLAVSDTGCGMTEEVKARIFEPFFTTKGVGKGTGLGLAVIHGIVQQAGGHVGFDSTPGVGTTFKVYLPRLDAPAGPAKSLPDGRPAPRGTETVLLAEDEDGVRALSRHVLVGCGYRVLEAADGAEALRVAGRHDGPIHLLVTDVVMPGTGGRELAERIGTIYPDVRVLYVSGYTDDAVVRHGVREEQVPFLQKPFSPRALAFKAREVLDAPRSRRP